MFQVELFLPQWAEFLPMEEVEESGELEEVGDAEVKLVMELAL